MFEISNQIPGGNIRLLSIEGNTVYLQNELRDTKPDWFFWAFRVTGAQGRTLDFVFDHETRVGFYGAAVSHDYKNWHWQYSDRGHEGARFSYTFGPEESCVYFAHDMLYRPERFFEFAQSHGLKLETLCTSRKGRSIPCFTLGNGQKHIVLTARHHACESTGSYVLEGVLDALCEKPLPDTTIFCVPIVDLDGVTEGDQGKDRVPHDHNRDYFLDQPSIYPEVAAIRRYIDTHPIVFACDFHSPYHIADKNSPENNKVFFLYKMFAQTEAVCRFSLLLEQNLLPGALKHSHLDDVSSQSRPWIEENCNDFVRYVLRKTGAPAMTLETAYYGLEDNIFS